MMSSSVSQVRYRLTEADWIAWQRIAGIYLHQRSKSSHWRLWLDWARAWLVYAAALIGGGYALALCVSTFVDPRWWNLAFLVGALVAGGLMREQDGVASEDQEFSQSLFAGNDVVIRLDEAAVSAKVGGLSLELAWDEILFVHREPEFALVAYDGTGSGILIPRHAFEDAEVMEAFLARIEAGRGLREMSPPRDSSL